MSDRTSGRTIHYSICLVLAAHFMSSQVHGQNLVPNADFENMVACPTGYSQLNQTTDWFSPTVLGTPDYYHACASSTVGVPASASGDQPAHSGDAYVGLYLYNSPDIREYVEVLLTQPLEEGTCYHFEMYVSLADNCAKTTDEIGAFLSGIPLSGIPGAPVLMEPAQIQNLAGNFLNDSSWSLIASDITANGGEQYLIIGNFKNDSSTALQAHPGTWGAITSYGFLDDVRLEPCSTSVITTAFNLQSTTVFPNPFDDHLGFHDPDGRAAMVRVFNTAGKVMVAVSLRNGGRIATIDWPSGVFFYDVLRSDGTNLHGRLVKF